MDLPISKVKATRKNPKMIVIAGFQKSGKTTGLASLEDNLVIDLEDGTGFLDAMKVNVTNLKDFSDLVRALQTSERKYRFGTIDTATKLEQIAWELAFINYKKMPIGKTFQGGPNDLINLPKGAGYGLQRAAFMDLINWLRPFFETLILVCHVKNGSYTKDGEEIEMVDINLTGALKTMIAADADAIGMFYRKKNQSILTFKGGESFLVEGRPTHLRGKEFVIIESDSENNLTINWSEVFI